MEHDPYNPTSDLRRRRTVTFGPYVLDLDGPDLLVGGAPVAIRATPLRVLVALARRIGQTVAKDELMAEVWPGVTVSDASVATALREVRRALGDDGAQQRYVETLRNRGYRLTDSRAAAEPTRAPAPPQDAFASVGLHDTDIQNFELLTRLGARLFEDGHHEDARDAYRAAALAARRQGDDARFVAAALEFAGEIANLETSIELPERVAFLEQAIACDHAARPTERARLRARLAANIAVTRRDDAISLAREAYSIAHRAGDPETLGVVLWDVYWVVWSPDSLDEQFELASEMIDAAERAGDAYTAGLAYQLLATAHLGSGDRVAAETATARGFERAEGREHAGFGHWRESWGFSMALLDGRFADAERHAEAALASASRQGTPNASLIYGSMVALLRFDQGRGHELARLLGNFSGKRMLIRVAVALIKSQTMETDAARLEFETIMGELDGVARDWEWLPMVSLLAELCAELGDAERAGDLYGALRPYENLCVVLGIRTACRGSVAFYLGLLARSAGRNARAIGHFELAIRANARLRALPLLARAQLALAEALIDRGRAIDLQRAADLLNESGELVRGLGLSHTDGQRDRLRDRL